ncbi:Eco57I restriction-modification methylase domain-containing protein [Corynebacterium frankenforstense]|uniref:Eco57I restriction-modification methylase domain-containing protein n=1 Tax=Corynebacterium frankenforstense TaxID=1230998 RepID=UPI002604E7E9|nr:Eco57I restriction-modification methylase domain-containing protein [Corynebacterium frankenforstense]
MSKKFDVVIGNPPYQEEAKGAGTRDTPVYHRFMDAAYEVGEKAVLITPARFLFNAGFTPKAWNEKMLSDPHLRVPVYVPNSAELFPGTDIKGGIAVTYRDAGQKGEAIGAFTSFPELNGILQKVINFQEPSLGEQVTSGRAYAYTSKMHAENPDASGLMSGDAQFRISTNTFDKLPFLFHESEPNDGQEYVQVLGLIKNVRLSRWIRSDYVTGPDSFATYKTALPAANGSGAFGETLSNPTVLEPNTAVTQSFITIGTFSARDEAESCLRYIKTKFARTMLGVLKITQHNPAKVWKHVPAQDFTAASDIDWSKPLPEIDQQLYAKYGLDDDEISFIESHVKQMD